MAEHSSKYQTEQEQRLISTLRRTVQELIKEPRSQLFLKLPSDLKKPAIRAKMKTSGYAPDKDFLRATKGMDMSLLANKANDYRVVEDVVTQKSRLNYTSGAPFHRFHADLADVNYIRPRSSEGKFVLLIVDTYSQQVFLYSVFKKDRLIEPFLDFFKKISERRKPIIYLQTDKGGEFFNRELRDLFKSKYCEHYTTDMNHGHAYFAEQKIKELKRRLTLLKAQDRTQWLKDLLKPIEISMNNTVISYIRLSPEQIANTPNLSENHRLKLDLWVGYYKTLQRETNARYTEKKDIKNKKLSQRHFRVGDRVYIASGRILKKLYKSALEKSSTGVKPQFNTEKIYEIIKVERAIIPNLKIYKIKESDTGDTVHGRFYADELRRIA